MTKIVLMLLICMVNVCFAIGDLDKAIYESYNKAREAIQFSIDAHGGLDKIKGIEDITLNYQGSFYNLGHYSKPWERREYQKSGILIFDRLREIIVNEDTLQRNNNSWVGKTYINPDEVSWLDHGEKKHLPINLKEYSKYRSTLLEFLPPLLLEDALNNAGSLQWLGEEKLEGQKHSLISYADGSGIRRVLYLNAKTGLLSKIDKLSWHEIYGDNIEEIIYSEYQKFAGLMLPLHREEKKFDQLEATINYQNITLNSKPDISQFNFPTTFLVKLYEMENNPVVQKENIKIVIPDSNLYILELQEHNNRVMFVDMGDYLIALEAPINSSVSEMIINKIHEIIPNKPIRYLLVGHYHPDYIGGIRSFVAEGATIITTAGNMEYLQSIANAPYTIQTDKLNDKEIKAVFEIVEQKKILESKQMRIEIYDIGSKTNHTDEYLIYYFPKQKLIFEGDLASFPKSGAGKAGKRAIGLYESMLELGLMANRIIQSWPLKDKLQYGTFSQLKSQVEKAKKEQNKGN